jgi:hypothetical protein
MRIEQASASNPVTNLALQGLMQTCPILADVDFFIRPGSSPQIKKSREGATPASIWRSLNENKTSTPPTPIYESQTKRILSWQTQVDKILEQRNEDPIAELAFQSLIEARENGWILQDKFFNGDNGTDAEEIDGFVNKVAAGQTLSLATDGYTNGLQVPVGNSDTNTGAQQNFIEEVLKMIEMVRGGASHLYVPANLKIRMLTVARNLGYYKQSKDELGASVDMIGDTIIRSAGRNKDGSSIIPFNETVGSSSDCASIYAVRWGEGVDLTALTSAGLVGEAAGLVGKFYTNEFDMDLALVLQDETALVKKTGWRL